MSAPPRGPRGGRGPRSRGGGRGGSNLSRSKASDGNGADGASTARRSAPRGRGRGPSSQNNSRGIAQAFQQVTRQQSTSRGAKTLRGGSRATTPSTNGFVTATSHHNKETPEERWSRLKVRREDERHEAVKMGLMSGNLPLSLDHAITMVGTCQDMCSEFERARRIYQKDVWGPEMDTIYENGEAKRVVNEKKMVKKFQRSAAGIDEQLPSDLRPPAVLLSTADYLFNELLSDEDSLVKANTFIWDRTRAIRNDFSIQQVKKVADVRIAIECYEKIARYHILSLHQIGGKGQERAGDSYNWQQDREQLDKTLLSLLTYYEHVKQRYRSPNEAEFRSYWILFQIGNFTASVEDRVQEWPTDILRHPRIRRALDIYAAASDAIDYKGPLQPRIPLAIAQQHWQKFWNLVGSKQTSYLMSCVCEIGFNVVRRIVLATISMGYFPGGKREVQDWTLEKMTEVLGFDDEDTTRNFIEQSNLMIGEASDGTQYFNLSTVRKLDGLPDPTAELPKQVHSWHLVERKRFGRSFPAVIAGMSFRTAREHDMLDPDWDGEVKAQSDQEDGLFVGENSHEAAATKVSTTLNPFASAFAPAASTEEKKPLQFSAFGQPSPFGQPSSGSGQSSTPSPFGQPSTTSVAPQSAMVQTTNQVSSTGSFGALPKSFSFATPLTSTPSEYAKPVTAATSNPFPAIKPSAVPRTAATSASITSASSPFAHFAPNAPSDGIKTSSNPFASLGTGTGSGATLPSASPFALPPSAKAPLIPSVQITPPSGESTQPKIDGEILKSKPAFAFPSDGGFSFPATPAEQKSGAVPTSAASLIAFPSSVSTGLGSKVTENAVNLNISANSSSNLPESILSGASKQIPQSTFSFQEPEVTPNAPTRPTLPTTQMTAPTQSVLPTFSFATPATESSNRTFMSSCVPTESSLTQPTSDLDRLQNAASGTTPLFASTLDLAAGSTTVDESWEQTRKTKGLDYLSEQLCCDDNRGYFKQYVANIAHNMIIDAIRAEEIRKANEKADQFRRYSLAYRYGVRWKKTAAILKSRRKRQEMKRRNAEIKQKRVSMATTQKSLEVSPTSLEEDLATFRAEQDNQKKVQEEVTAQEGERLMLSFQGERGQHTAHTSATNSFDLIGQRHVEPMAPPARPKTKDLVPVPGTSRGHQRSRTQPDILGPHNGLYRISKPSREASPALSSSSRTSLTRASLINGGSLADLGLPFGKKASTMQSPYFRLKAAGFGPTWKGDFSSSISGTKRPRLSGDDVLSNGSLHGTHKLSAPAPKRLRSPPDISSLSSPIRHTQEDSFAVSFGSSTSSNGVYKRSTEDDDLLARARKLRKVLEEGEAWFKDEVERDELRRSQELRRSHQGVRPGSQAGSPTGPNGEDLKKLPKFYGRVSRFVPREEYGVRREKKQEELELKGKEKMNGNVLSNGISGRGTGSRQMPPPAPPEPEPDKGGTSWDDAIEL